MRLDKRSFLVVSEYVNLIANLQKRLEDDTLYIKELKENLNYLVYSFLDDNDVSYEKGTNYRIDLENKTIEIITHTLMAKVDVMEV